MAQLNHSMDISLSRSIIKDNLNTTMPVTSLVRDHDITTLTKISQVLESNSSYLIMTHWKCTGRYSYAREHLMLSLWGIEALPQWVKLLVPTKSMSYLNPNAKDLLYCWTQMPSNTPSTWVSSLLTTKSQGGVLPDGKDVNDLGRKETLKLIYNTRYQSYQELVKLRNSLD